MAIFGKGLADALMGMGVNKTYDKEIESKLARALKQTDAATAAAANMFGTGLSGQSYVDYEMKRQLHEQQLAAKMAQAQKEAQERLEAYDPNKLPAMQAPLSVLRNLWLAKWGDAWVRAGDIFEDDFWRLGYQRMAKECMFEQHDYEDPKDPKNYVGGVLAPHAVQRTWFKLKEE